MTTVAWATALADTILAFSLDGAADQRAEVQRAMMHAEATAVAQPPAPTSEANTPAADAAEPVAEAPAAGGTASGSVGADVDAGAPGSTGNLGVSTTTTDAAAASTPAPAPTPTPAVATEPLAGPPAPEPEPPTAPEGPAPTAEASVPATQTQLSTRGGAAPAGSGEWGFFYGGYFRAPMRIGRGERRVADGEDPIPGQGKTTYHSPLTPDDQYLSWQHTNHSQRDWAELFFGYGNARARGIASIESWSFTDPMWQLSDAQFGISQGYVEIEPRLPWPLLGLKLRAGAFGRKYGMAGKYDGGEFDTYLFGRLHQMGESIELTAMWKRFVFSFEHGFGTTRPNPSIYNNGRFTLVNHAHAGVTWRGRLSLTGHYINSWAAEEDRQGANLDAVGFIDPPDGSLTVMGGDLRWDGRKFGYLYSGFSYVRAKNAGVVGPAVEVIHSKGGGEWNLGIVSNYLEGSRTNGSYASNGNGQVYTYLGQYEHSVRSFLAGDEGFWGNGTDIGFKVYAMFNKINSEDATAHGKTRLKYGTDVYFSALPWIGGAVRYDRVQPNSDVPEQSFSILSPRIFLRSEFVTHETISIQYSRYFYNDRECDPADLSLCVQPPVAPAMPEGFGAGPDIAGGTKGAPQALPDLNVFSVTATIWWN